MGKAKIGRNKPCPCRSGRKYKKCCLLRGGWQFGMRSAHPRSLPPEIIDEFARRQEAERQRIRRFGNIPAPVFIEHQGTTLVAVGSRLFWPKKGKTWKTLHDFLFDYVATVFGEEWGRPEIRKPFEDRHPVAQWYHRLCSLQAKNATERDSEGIYSAIATGPVMAYLALAYDLYTLENHALLQEKLLRRLRIKDQFQGARYETYVSAAFVRAGFDVALDDEGDRRTTHCEFVATHRETNARYSVEAKSRHRAGFLGQPGAAKPLDEIEAEVSTLLVRALRKKADYDRIVFIDVNVPPQAGKVFESEWFRKAAAQVKRMEDTQRREDRLPQAFVFLTNHPYHYVGDDAPEPGRSVIFTAINNPDFRQPDPGVVDQKYPAVGRLFDSVVNHTEVPDTLEGTSRSK